MGLDYVKIDFVFMVDIDFNLVNYVFFWGFCLLVYIFGIKVYVDGVKCFDY